MRKSAREMIGLGAALIGFEAGSVNDPAPLGRVERNGRYVAAQTTLVASVVALALTVKLLVNGSSGGPAVWIIGGLLLALPAALHHHAAPPRRSRGALAGLVALVALLAAAALLGVFSSASFWPGYVAVAVAWIVAGAVFGAVAPVVTPQHRPLPDLAERAPDS